MIKKCSCGKVWDKVPEKFRLDQYGGFYWECECESTLTYFDEEAKEKIKKESELLRQKRK